MSMLSPLRKLAIQEYNVITSDLFDIIDEQVVASRAGQQVLSYFAYKIKDQIERGLWTVTPAQEALSLWIAAVPQHLS